MRRARHRSAARGIAVKKGVIFGKVESFDEIEEFFSTIVGERGFKGPFFHLGSQIGTKSSVIWRERGEMTKITT